MPQAPLAQRSRVTAGTPTTGTGHPAENKEAPMRSSALYGPVKIVGYVVLAAMASAIVYAVWISLTHWGGIGV